ncbi:MAG: hypothetical protein IKE21_06550 [Erysipelotrichaceae bacterium]|nr:hypothetical protein [Erysipelotrichaceae bacterium]
MARIVEKKRRKIRLEAVAVLLIIPAVILSVFSSLFLRQTKASLMIRIQNMNNECTSLRTENQRLAIEIQTLQNKDRIYNLATEAGLQQNEANVISMPSAE